MKKNVKNIIINKNDMASTNETQDIEIFKSRVANAVLDYMEAQTDSNLIESLERVSIFLSNISVKIEDVFDNQEKAFKEKDDAFDIGDDLFSINKQTSSSAIH